MSRSIRFLLSSVVNRFVCDAAQLDRSAFMIVSGISSAQEHCLTVGGGDMHMDGIHVILEPCADAIAMGDGRELFSLNDDGRIMCVHGEKCISPRMYDGRVVTMNCNAASKFDPQANGQFRFPGFDGKCLSQEGRFLDFQNVVPGTEVNASSSSDGHIAGMAIDGDVSSFWASAINETEHPVKFQIDFGSELQVESADIYWEQPAKSFTMQLSIDGKLWETVFSTENNPLTITHARLKTQPASQLRMILNEPFYGQTSYSIRNMIIRAKEMWTLVEDCSDAAKSLDGRDKYFIHSVDENFADGFQKLHAEIPTLEAAKASLSASVSALLDLIPQSEGCKGDA